MSKITNLWRLNVFFFILICVVIVGVLSSAFFLIIIRFSSTEEEEPHFNDYQVLSYNPSTKDTSVGMLNLQRELEEEEFISYKNRIGNHVLISNFGEKEFGCTGKCYCNEEGNERRVTTASSSILKRSLIYLVSAVSASVALTTATKYFDDECKRVLTSEEERCSIQSVFSEPGDCVHLIDPKNPPDEDPFDWEEYVTRGTDDKRTRFQCSGSCKMRTGWFPLSAQQMEEENSEMLDYIRLLSFTGGCSKYKIEMTFKLDTKNTERARMHFIQEHLHPFCTAVSEEEWVNIHTGKTNKDPICFGGLTFFQNPSVECYVWNFE